VWFTFPFVELKSRTISSSFFYTAVYIEHLPVKYLACIYYWLLFYFKRKQKNPPSVTQNFRMGFVSLMGKVPKFTFVFIIWKQHCSFFPFIHFYQKSFHPFTQTYVTYVCVSEEVPCLLNGHRRWWQTHSLREATTLFISAHGCFALTQTLVNALYLSVTFFFLSEELDTLNNLFKFKYPNSAVKLSLWRIVIFICRNCLVQGHLYTLIAHSTDYKYPLASYDRV